MTLKVLHLRLEMPPPKFTIEREKIQKALQYFGANCQDVVRTRMSVTYISRSAEYGKAHQDFFANIQLLQRW